MQEKLVALVTGANKGIGAQIAKELVAKGFIVFVGSRDIGNGEKMAETIGKDAFALQLDVTDQSSIDLAALHIEDEYGRLDILVNNAGVSHVGKTGTAFEEIIASTRMSVVAMDEVRQVFEINVFGVIALTQAMLPLLRKAQAGRIVNLSSGAGSLTYHSDLDNPSRKKFGIYGTSKAALNAVTIAMAIDLEDTNIKVNAACPGFTNTDLNNFEGTQTVEEAAREPVRLALLGADGPSGTLSGFERAVPW